MWYPGTAVEISAYEKGASRQLFSGIFAAGGITLSQVSIISGLETYLIQNWVKRGFVEPPSKRLYSQDQLARIIIINMLKDTLQIDKICSLIKVLQGATKDKADDLISDSELYHIYVDMLADCDFCKTDEAYVFETAQKALNNFKERVPNTKKQLARILQVMLYAHQASVLRKNAENILAELH